jgi:hypothetical protein
MLPAEVTRMGLWGHSLARFLMPDSFRLDNPNVLYICFWAAINDIPDTKTCFMTQTFLYIFLRVESGPEAIVGGIISGIMIVIVGAIINGLKKATAKKRDAEKIK